MSQMFRLENRPMPAPPAPAGRAGPAGPAGIESRPGLRLILLSLATGILLLGAAVAGIACYLTLGRG
jgi:hypothetical protein